MDRQLLAACTAFLIAMAADAEGEALNASTNLPAKAPEPALRKAG
ncbi:MAG TPA: hypothetical protein VFV75_19390 [Candidatus Polarisedimenticolaceae bacterium]|nr:hypothetical protein [Candidatus Polarisedimenticolaceae bacterium]